MDSFGLIILIALGGVAIFGTVAWTLAGNWLRYNLRRSKPRARPVNAVARAATAGSAPERRTIVPPPLSELQPQARAQSLRSDEEPTQPRAHVAHATAAAHFAATQPAPDTQASDTDFASTNWPSTQPASQLPESAMAYAETMPMPLTPMR